MTKQSFGLLPDGQEANLYTISCGRLTAAVSDFGATLVRLIVPDALGRLADVVLGFDQAADYIPGNACLGATVGRYANRIGGAAFSLNGKKYSLAQNDGSNNLHSGPDFWFKRMWNVAEVGEDFITLTLHSPDGDQGFPGNLDVSVTYRLLAEPVPALSIRYHGLCDQDTVLSMTNHSYFNLAGHDHPEAALGQYLWLNADAFTPADEGSIPTGDVCPVAGTPMDFTVEKPLGRDIGADYQPLHFQAGYDHNFVLNSADGAPAARLRDPVSGRNMEVYTDRPGVQVYSANFTDETGKGGVHYTPRSGLCLETQFFPDCVNKPQFPSCTLKAGEVYESRTVYAFPVLK